MPLTARRSSAGRVSARRWRLPRAVFTILTLGLAAPVTAQVGVSASVTSDYLYRGVSLSNGRPALSVTIAYDHPSGVYAGGSVIGETTATLGPRILGYAENIGYARRAKSGVTWDIGVSHTGFTEYYDKGYPLNDTELYSGVRVGDISYYVYYSPHYYGEGVHTLYIDVSATHRIARRWRLFGHVGVLTPLAGPGGPNRLGEQFDLRAGVAAEFKGGELQLAWTVVRPDADYLVGPAQKRDVLSVGAAFFF